jgi:hypothetical protein
MTDILGDDQTSQWEEQIRLNSQRIKFPVVITGDPELDVNFEFNDPDIAIKEKEKNKADKKTVKVVDLNISNKKNKRKLF